MPKRIKDLKNRSLELDMRSFELSAKGFWTGMKSSQMLVECKNKKAKGKFNIEKFNGKQYIELKDAERFINKLLTEKENAFIRTFSILFGVDIDKGRELYSIILHNVWRIK